MEPTLCIYLGKESITSFIVHKSKCGLVYETCCQRTVPLLSLYISGSNDSRFIFGVEMASFMDMLQNTVVLENEVDFLSNPVADSESMSFSYLQFNTIDSNQKQLHYPVFYLVRNLKKLYDAWYGAPVHRLYFCCSLDLFSSYSLLLEDELGGCGFPHFKVFSDVSMWAYATFHSQHFHSEKCKCLAICSGKQTGFVSSVSFSSKADNFMSWEEMSSLSMAAAISSVKDTTLGSLSDFEVQSVLEKLRYCSQVELPTEAFDRSSLQVVQDKIQSALPDTLKTLLKTCSWKESDIQFILLQGTIASHLYLFIQSLYPTIPLLSVQDESILFVEGVKRYVEKVASSAQLSNEYVGEMINGVREGYGKEFQEGRCIYSGFWKGGKFDGIGEKSNLEGKIIFKGQFQNGLYQGKGELALQDDEKIVGIFDKGELVDGSYTTTFANGMKRFEGEFKNGQKNGVGKEYSKTGKLVFDGNFYNNKYSGVGRLYQPDGSFAEGSFIDGKLNGEVHYFNSRGNLRSDCTFDNGVEQGKGKVYSKEGYLLYEGGIMDGQYFGPGTLYYPGGVIQYEGEFLSNAFNGYGQLYDPEGNLVYIGEFHQGKRDGQGKEYTADMKMLYTGSFKNDKRSGRGKLFFSAGHYYDGNFVDDQMTGVGKMVWSDGQFYQGDFVNGKQDGKGTFTWSSGRKYVGEFREGVREGNGKLYDNMGSCVYEGEWKEDEPSGKGKLYYTSGDYYVGEVKNGKRVGQGIQYTKKNEIEYKGNWVDDQPHGFGTFYYENKCYYEGQWVHGQQEGTGRFTYANGSYYIGMYKNGVRHGKGCIVNAQGKITYEGFFENNRKSTDK